MIGENGKVPDEILFSLERLYNSLSSKYYGHKDYSGQEKFKAKEIRENPGLVAYPYIPMSPRPFIEDLIVLKKAAREFKKYSYEVKFLDAGCGIGLTVSLAKSFGFNAKGIELDEKNVKVAQELLGVKVYQGDILKHDYSDYDIIYYYCPIHVKKWQIKFEKRVEKQMKVGALLAPHLKQDSNIYKDKRFKLVTDNPDAPRIWKKVSQ